ncbi:MAG: single-stranded DNA-binding protein [bacterium]|nr:single-stranded DNA-binding protein [bacterium]
MQEYRVPKINEVRITGNLVAEPELKYMPDGKAVCNFRIANSSRYLDKKTNQWVDGEPTFVRIAVFGPSAERLGETIKKGYAVFVEGRLQSRSWETPEGDKRSSIEIIANRVQNLTRAPGEKSTTEEDVSEDDTKKENELPF